MKGLTLTQPWATLVALGHKRVETRSWSSRYRGPIAIHAAKGFPGFARDFAAEERAIGRCPERLPFGAIVAVAELTRVVPVDTVASQVSALERRLGDWTRGRYAWFLEDVLALEEPIPARGALSLWPLDDALACRLPSPGAGR